MHISYVNSGVCPIRSAWRHPAPRRVSGFTLIELLVVVAIIAVLMAVLLPTLASARERAKTVTCLSQVRQMGQASYMYAQENNAWLPVYTPELRIVYYGSDWIYNGSSYKTSGGTPSTWTAHGLFLSLGYLNTNKVFYCPSGNVRDGQSQTYWGPNWSSRYCSYDFIGGIYLNDRSRITDVAGKAILVEDGLFSTAWNYHNNLINVLYIGGDAVSIKQNPLKGRAWQWNLIDRN